MTVAFAQDRRMLSNLLAGVAVVDSHDDREIHGISLDSRRIQSGDCFIALSGEICHGAEFAKAAVEAGAVAVLIEGDPVNFDLMGLDKSTPVVCISNLRKAVGRIASRFFGDPSRSLDVIAVTGTNGKTTVAQLCAHALKRLRGEAGYAGTLGIGMINELRPSENTTPDPITLQSLFRDLCHSGCKSVAIEVSSHGIVQHRVIGTMLNVVVFTNLGHDHLDYHSSWDAYAAVKKSLLRYEGIRHAIINIDDNVGRDIAFELDHDICCWTYGVNHTPPARSKARHLKLLRYVGGHKRSTLVVGTPSGQVEITTPLIGDFNAQNLVASLGALMALGVDVNIAADALSQTPAIAGRMQTIETNSTEAPVVVIDYAHTPEGLVHVLATLKSITSRHLVCVFGCGGDRDATKRGPMGRAAEQGADIVIVTSDNPRGEDNGDIAAAILLGMREPERVQVIHDRARAIESAIKTAGAGDTVLVAGKGHEVSQEIAGMRYRFSDIEVAAQILEGQAQ
ncbi:MAG TPA: UDP-N-acetylmuramoyl-L-alanyl-D-glutamate--2,6-diaminopimelate ligase [Gammaproteobacteria bacterium]|nr:UDP-N-acetylmuramoyl-L-alanyl-D-glutamate--2,6-diaminopimelate ligase [Gammaproteobacteria bacterium]